MSDLAEDINPITSWRFLAPIVFEDVVVLGPKCNTAICVEPARFTVWWPGRTAQYCDICTRWAEHVAFYMGFELATKRLEYAVGRDDAEQRFSLLELT